MSSLPLYEIIFKEFEQKILNKELDPGDKLPTEYEISIAYGVSRITATRALKELELRNYIRRIKGSGSYVNDFVKNPYIAKNRPEGHLSIISLVMPFEGDYQADLMQGIEDVARDENYFVTFHNSNGDSDLEKILIEEIIARGSHGLIVYPCSSTKNLSLYSSLLIDNYPFILIDKNIHGLETPLVWTNNQKGFFDITKHLFDMGHKRVVFIGTSIYSQSSEMERYKGFCKAHVDCGVVLLDRHYYSESDFSDIPSNYLSEKPIYEREIKYFFDHLMSIEQSERPTAIAAVNDELADLLIRYALEKGLRIPQDFAITGFDNRVFSAHVQIPITTMAQPMAEIGRKAAELLFKSISDGSIYIKTNVIDAKLIVRASSSN